MRWLSIHLLIVQLLLVLTLVHSLATNSPDSKTVTLAVCTGADCRVDGASACLRLIQERARLLNQAVESNSHEKAIQVQSRPCLGPCGDGPNVLVLTDTSPSGKGGKRVIQAQPNRGPGSLAPADMFGDNPVGVYQVRTQEHLDFVMELAAETAGLSNEAFAKDQDVDDEKRVILSSSRVWFDRPRNERKFLQRLGQFLVVLGLAEYSKSHQGQIGSEQWIVAGVLLVASNLIMKENMLEMGSKKVFSKTRN